MRSLRRSAVVAVALAVFIVQSLQAQVLQHVPADALIVLKVNNLRQTSDKVAKLLNTLGVAQMAGIQDPLAMVKQELGVNAGLNETGEAAFAFIDPAKSGADEDESMVILLPVADYNAFLGNFQQAQTEGAISSVQIKGSPAHVSKWGEYAAISPSKQLVTSAPQAALSVAQALSNDLRQSDAIFYANIEKIRPLALPELEKGKAEAQRDIDRQLGRNEMQQKFAPVAKAAVMQGINAMQTFLNDANAGAVSLTLSDGGIAIDAIADFKTDSYLGKAVSSIQPAQGSLVRGLPQADYLMYGGWAINSPAVADVIVDYVKPIIEAFGQAQGVDPAQSGRITTALRQLVTSSRSTSFGLLAPAGQLGQEALFQTVSVAEGDAAKLAAAQKDLAQASQALMGDLLGQRGTFSYSENAKTVGGVSFSTMKLDLNLAANPQPAPNETPQQAQARQREQRNMMQAQQALAVVYGPGGMAQYMGVAGDRYIVASGLSDENLAKVVESAKAGTDLLAGKAHVQPVTAALPQQRAAVLYLPLDQWARTGSTYAAMFGFPVQMQLPPDLPPIGIALTAQGGTLRVESYIPVDLVQSLIAAGLQAAGGAAGGGGMGDPGGI
jgi:hypothetical protein